MRMKDDPLYRPLPDSFDPPPAPGMAPAPPRVPGFSWSLAGATFLWLAGLMLALWFIVPKFAEVYGQVKVPLPRLTSRLIDVSWAAVRHPVPFVLGVLLLSAWVGTWKGWWRSGAQVLLPAALAVTVATIVCSLFLPLIGSLEGVPSGRAEFRCGR